MLPTYSEVWITKKNESETEVDSNIILAKSKLNIALYVNTQVPDFVHIMEIEV